MSKHTPGPWEVDGPHLTDRRIAILGAEKDDGWQVVIATMRTPDSRMPEEEQRANASLIAAAPELLESLKNALRELDKVWPGLGNQTGEAWWSASDTRTKLVRIIAKAEGPKECP